MRRNYQDPEYKEWRKRIRARDKSTCQFPGCDKRKAIEAHHILRWQDFPGLRYNDLNGICLCKEHHKIVTGNEDHYIKILGDIVRSKL